MAKREHKVPSFLFMMGENSLHKIKKILESYFQEEENQGYFLVSLELNNKKLLVFIDGDEAVSFKICKQVSRHLESFLDENKWLGEKYGLEVSSPGLDRPLQNPRQFKKHIGRKAEIFLKDGTVHSGKLLKIENDTLDIESSTVNEPVELDKIDKMKIIVSF